MDPRGGTETTEPMESTESFDHRDSSEDGDFRCAGGADSFAVSASSPGGEGTSQASPATAGGSPWSVPFRSVYRCRYGRSSPAVPEPGSRGVVWECA
jgi:hypothetical protein